MLPGQNTMPAAARTVGNLIGRQAGSGVDANETPDPEIPSVVPEILGIAPDEFEDTKEMLAREIDQMMALPNGEDDQAEEG